MDRQLAREEIRRRQIAGTWNPAGDGGYRGSALTRQSRLGRIYDTGDPETTLHALMAAREDPDAVARYGARPLANAEHEAFTYYAVEDNPLMAISMLGAIPGYDVAKRMGLMTDDQTSEPGIDQMAAGYRGMWRGLNDWMSPNVASNPVKPQESRSIPGLGVNQNVTINHLLNESPLSRLMNMPSATGEARAVPWLNWQLQQSKLNPVADIGLSALPGIDRTCEKIR